MTTINTLTRRFETVFPPHQAIVLAKAITDAYSELVKTGDFNELKAIVKNLADAQQRTEAKVGRLAEAQERLIEAQQRTEAKVGQLAEAQQRTENSLNTLTQVVTGMKQELGGLSRSMGYALENEAYRALPGFLQTHHGITLYERIVRTVVGGEEINFLAQGKRNGKAICLVGESKLRLDERRGSGRAIERVAAQLERKAQAVKQQHPDCEMVLLVVTHFARPSALEKAQKRGLLVVQTYEW
ncbi:MAG: hypothetical protein ACE5GO_07820 [Anaerolineales bacterium]